jgi:hypothetical protein
VDNQRRGDDMSFFGKEENIDTWCYKGYEFVGSNIEDALLTFITEFATEACNYASTSTNISKPYGGKEDMELYIKEMVRDLCRNKSETQ